MQVPDKIYARSDEELYFRNRKQWHLVPMHAWYRAYEQRNPDLEREALHAVAIQAIVVKQLVAQHAVREGKVVLSLWLMQAALF